MLKLCSPKLNRVSENYVVLECAIDGPLQGFLLPRWVSQYVSSTCAFLPSPAKCELKLTAPRWRSYDRSDRSRGSFRRLGENRERSRSPDGSGSTTDEGILGLDHCRLAICLKLYQPFGCANGSNMCSITITRT